MIYKVLLAFFNLPGRRWKTLASQGLLPHWRESEVPRVSPGPVALKSVTSHFHSSFRSVIAAPRGPPRFLEARRVLVFLRALRRVQVPGPWRIAKASCCNARGPSPRAPATPGFEHGRVQDPTHTGIPPTSSSSKRSEGRKSKRTNETLTMLPKQHSNLSPQRPHDLFMSASWRRSSRSWAQGRRQGAPKIESRRSQSIRANKRPNSSLRKTENAPC